MADPSFGLKISPGVVLRNVLQQYPSGGQFFLEALQNADDTGRASKFCALLDLRQHPATSLRQPVQPRTLLQGESILFYDNAGFSDRDWRSLQFMCDSEKRQSPHEAGIFGMGSRSYFHITDVIQVLSRRKLSALDPDDILESGHFGEQVDFIDSKLLENYPDEGEPFLGVFGCDLRSEFQGTIIRAALRTPERAKTCTFMPQTFELSRAEKIFADFEETLKNGEVALFLMCIRCVELWRWEATAKSPTLIASTHLGVSSGHELPEQVSSPWDVKAYLERFKTFADLEVALKAADASPPQVLDVVDMATKVRSGEAVISRRWLRCGFFTRDREIVDLVTLCSCVPLVVLAVPLGQPVDGIVFSHTPLPLSTKLPVHVNAYWRLHDNRRALWRLSPDLDGEHRLWASWNEHVLKAMVPRVYAKALQLVASVHGLVDDFGFGLWPKEGNFEKSFAVVVDVLVRELHDKPVLVMPNGQFVRPKDAVYLVMPTPALQEVRQQLLQLCVQAEWSVVDPPAHVVELLHARGCLTKQSCTAAFYEVVLARAADLEQPCLAKMLLALIEWAGTWKEQEVRELDQKISGVAWVLAEDGSVRTLRGCFDPLQSPEPFRTVRERRARLQEQIAGAGLDAGTVWRVLHACGLKTQLTWEDAAAEAAAVVEDGDVVRAGQLLQHLDKCHASMQGDRSAALERLGALPWLPATRPSGGAAAPPGEQEARAAHLLALSDVFPASARKLVWAVAPSLHVEAEPTLRELRAGRSVEEEPQVLLEQIRALADSAKATDGGPRLISVATFEHLRAAFAALVPLLPKVPRLEEAAILRGVAFVPCLADDSSGHEIALFEPSRAAFQAQHDHRSLSPAVGIVKPADHTVRLLAQAASVAQEPRAGVLAEVLCTQSPREDLAVVLSVELAGRLRKNEERPDQIKVPTSDGGLEVTSQVYIDDAPWRQRQLVTLHPRISAEDGRLLGCTSVRAEMARQCEEVFATNESTASVQGDSFGQEADLVSQVRQLLQEYGDSADLVKEFVQNSDDAGAKCVAFYLKEDTFGTERVVDPRTATLQGTSLYVCSDKALTEHDIERMQRVGHSEKRLEFGSSGRFGVGLNVMYRYCDCPQLMANSRLHYFDLTRSFVAQTGMSRGRQFRIEKMREHFPDTIAPFEMSEFNGKFPTVFRLALRTKRSDLGFKMAIATVRREMQQAASMGDKMLLFARNLQRLEFHDCAGPMIIHDAMLQAQDDHDAFFKQLPSSPLEFKPGKLLTHLAQKSITSLHGETTCTAEWAVSHRVGVSDEDMFQVLKAQYEQPHGVALLPHGAAAFKVNPCDPKVSREGRVCCGLPTPFKSGSSAWVHGSFALLSSRKSLPLPEESEMAPSLNKSWNSMLIQGPVAESIHGLIVHCTALVLYQGLSLESYFSLFPQRGERLQTLLAGSAMRASLPSAVFPVFRGSAITWVAGPRPTFATKELPDELQQALVADGMKLAQMPEELLAEYEAATGETRNCLKPPELSRFLQSSFQKVQADQSADLDLASTGMACLARKGFIITMLSFIAKGLWQQHIKEHQNPHSFQLTGLIELPLLLTHAQQITTFGLDRLKFSTGRDMLPNKKNLFIDRDALRVINDSADTTAEGIVWEVRTEIPGIRPFTLYDLLPFREEVEKAVYPHLGFMTDANELLRLFWFLVAETVQGASAAENKKLLVELVGDWKMLPVLSLTGNGENGEACIKLTESMSCVVVPFLDTDPAVVQSLTGILQQCGINTIQHDMIGDDRLATLMRPMCVASNEELLQLLVQTHSAAVLDGMQRHDLLAYFSVLCVKGGTKLTGVSKLPLFRTADVESSFTSLQDEVTHCSVDPHDPHKNALVKLKLPGLVQLAWPTQQVKPIYEYCEVNLCSGEEFMVNMVIPKLPMICENDPDGKVSSPFFEELHAYTCLDRSQRVKELAAQCEFVPSEDLSRVGKASEFTSSASGAAIAFADILRPYLPAKWIQQSPKNLELLHALGMDPGLSSSMILLCARDLDEAANGETMSEEMQVKSFELVEEFARAAEEVWPKQRPPPTANMVHGRPALPSPAAPAESVVKDMTNLLQAAGLRILMAYQHKGGEARTQECQGRNAKRQSEKQKKTVMLEHGELSLVSFKGTAFRGAKNVVWSCCPLDNHHNPNSEKGIHDCPNLKYLLDNHTQGMNNVFASFVVPQHAPLNLVVRHLECLCTNTETEPGVACVKRGTEANDDFKACWKYLAERAENLDQLEVKGAFERLRKLPCVAVASEDVADKPAEVLLLTRPSHAFFQLPVLRGKEASLRLYLRQVQAETTREATVFKALGAAERPRAADYAEASERVATRASTLGHAGWEWVVSVLEACARGIHEDLVAVPNSVEVNNLHMFTTDGRIEKASKLLWADEPRWLSRCSQEESLMFCKLNGIDEREIAQTLLQCSGLRKLSTELEERRLVEETEQEMSSPLKMTVEHMLQTYEFACGLRAVMVHNHQGNSQIMKQTVPELLQDLRSIRFRCTTGHLRSGLFFKADGSHPRQGQMIQGSPQELHVYFDDTQRAVFFSAFSDGQEDGFVAELAIAMRKALPLLAQVDSLLLEALMRCALREGVGSIKGFLEKRDIKVVSLKSGHLGPGDLLPQDLYDHLNWTMETTFGEGECCAVAVRDYFVVGEVARWPDGSSPGEGINRSYLVRISSDGFETKKHFEVYKIQPASAPKVSENSMDLVAVEKSSRDVDNPTGGEGPMGADEKAVKEVKAYLHEMSRMSPSDYKTVMRRLFKTWHPDKVGDTPVANRVFNLLRRHEHWFKRKTAGESVGDDSWLDDEKEDVGKGPILALPSRVYQPAEGNQGSWFDEFQREMEQAALAKTAKAKCAPRQPEVVLPPKIQVDPGSWQQPVESMMRPDGQVMFGNRIIDRAQAPKWLQQARLEFVAAKRLVEPSTSFRPLPAAAVWHCQQVVEMAVKSAMLRTCGVAEDEVTGGAAHDIEMFVRRLVGTGANSEEQRRAQLVPGTDRDIEWLHRCYLGARYPKDGRDGIPGLRYTLADAERAIKLAEAFLVWAAHVEDLPDPNKVCTKRWSHTENEVPQLADMSGNLAAAQPATLPSSVPSGGSANGSSAKRPAEEPPEGENEVKKTRRWAKKAPSQ